MDSTNPANNLTQLKQQVAELTAAIAGATRDGDIYRNAQLTLRLCRTKKQLRDAEAELLLAPATLAVDRQADTSFQGSR
jgi:hypothetical protein